MADKTVTLRGYTNPSGGAPMFFITKVTLNGDSEKSKAILEAGNEQAIQAQRQFTPEERPAYAIATFLRELRNVSKQEGAEQVTLILEGR